MIVTIDGPAGAGKSSVAGKLAARLGFHLLDTGSMYRSLTYAAMQRQVEWCDTERLLALVDHLRIDLTTQEVFMDQENISPLIRSPEVTRHVFQVASNPAIRERLNQWQRSIADGRNIVTEGRDQGTEVFPEAVCKIFLTASVAERARRRMRQLQQNHDTPELADLMQEISERDRGDRERTVGALRPADDACQFSTDGLQEEEVVSALEFVVRCRQS